MKWVRHVHVVRAPHPPRTHRDPGDRSPRHPGVRRDRAPRLVGRPGRRAGRLESDGCSQPDVSTALSPGSAQLSPQCEPQPAPRVVDRAHLVVDPPGRQELVAQHVFGDVGGHATRPLRPGDPDRAARSDRRRELRPLARPSSLAACRTRPRRRGRAGPAAATRPPAGGRRVSRRNRRVRASWRSANPP